MFSLKKLRTHGREESEDYVDAMEPLDFADEGLAEDDGLVELPTPEDEVAPAGLAPTAHASKEEMEDEVRAEPRMAEEAEELSSGDRSDAMAQALKAFATENIVDEAMQAMADRVPVVEMEELQTMTQEVFVLLSEETG